MKRTLSFIVLAALALGASACSRTLTAGAAVVNGVSIPQAALERELQGQAAGPIGDNLDAARQTLEGLIQQELLRQVAAEKNITVSEKTVNDRFEEIKAQTPNFETELANAGLTEESLRDRLELNLLAEQVAGTLIEPISAADLRDVYRQQREQYRQVRGREILFAIDENNSQEEAEQAARAALRDIRSGTSFATLARRLSDDPATRERGGSFGDWLTIAPPEVDQGYAEALWGARIGRAGGPVLDQRGYHVYLVTDKRYEPFDDVKERLREQLEQDQRSGALQGLLAEEVANARIMVNPRIGDWDEERRQIVPHQSFVPAEPAEEVVPPDLSVVPGS